MAYPKGPDTRSESPGIVGAARGHAVTAGGPRRRNPGPRGKEGHGAGQGRGCALISGVPGKEARPTGGQETLIIWHGGQDLRNLGADDEDIGAASPSIHACMLSYI